MMMTDMPSPTHVQCCVVFLVCLVGLVLCNLGPEYGASAEDVDPFPKRKCESLLVNCSCYDYLDLYGIICDSVSNYSRFSQLLASDAIFEVNSTYEITFNEIKYLPPRVLDGLIVFCLFLDDPGLAAIDERAFDGVQRLRRFHIRQSKIQVSI